MLVLVLVDLPGGLTDDCGIGQFLAPSIKSEPPTGPGGFSGISRVTLPPLFDKPVKVTDVVDILDFGVWVVFGVWMVFGVWISGFLSSAALLGIVPMVPKIHTNSTRLNPATTYATPLKTKQRNPLKNHPKGQQS